MLHASLNTNEIVSNFSSVVQILALLIKLAVFNLKSQEKKKTMTLLGLQSRRNQSTYLYGCRRREFYSKCGNPD
jgi:hypothetical protein